MLEEIIATPTGNDFITFEIKDVVPIAAAKKYAGISASVVARIKNTKTPFSIDFGVGDGVMLASVLDRHMCSSPDNGLLKALYSTHPHSDDRVAHLQDLGVAYSRY